MHYHRRSMPSISELAAFECAARHLSFTRAAEELHLTQGAISRQIINLEEALGVRLFQRVRRSIVLTDMGRAYERDVRRILLDLAGSTDRIRAIGSSPSLSLAVLPTFATRWLMPRVSRFIRAHPGVMPHFHVRLVPFDFEVESFDAAIHFGDGVWPGAEAHFLCREQIVVVASPAFIEHHGLMAPEDLIRVTRLHQTTRPDAWAQWFQHQGLVLDEVQRGPRLEQFGMIAEAAVGGLGAALVPRFLVEQELADGRLETLAGLPLASTSAYWLIVPDRKRDDTLVISFRDWLLQEIAARGSRSPEGMKGNQ
jgi:LysR family transcriptional regulator, glycine cleavage system transcriptional activator